jgi:hypothetical protein
VVSGAGGERDWRRLHGRPAPPERPLPLRAGPLSALLDGPDLRHVRVGGVELVQRVYIAVRDAPWNTIPAVYTDWHRDIGDDRFVVTFHARHRHEAIDFAWDGRIEGRPDGTITYAMDGICHGVFQYSKIGVNVHHDLPGSIGRPYRARHGERTWTGVLPAAIAPQRIVDGTLSGMFDPYEELAIEVVDGLEAVVALDGDLLELQDHRNWIDANFKSYGTPLALGFPFDSTDGQRIRQVLTIGVRGDPPTRADVPPSVRVGAALGRSMPPMGLGLASHGEPLTEDELARLRAIGPAHLRVDLDLRPDDPLADLDRGAREAAAIGAGMELALHVPVAADAALAGLAGRLATIGVPVARVIVYPLADGFSAMGALAPPDLVLDVAAALGSVVDPAVVVGGTEQSFADTNRAGSPDPRLAGIAFAMSPTVHAADDASIIENVVGAGEVVRFARTLADDRPVHVSPVTIATRFGPYPNGPAAPGDLPPAVDPRGASALGAAWTAATLGELARAGAASVTWYETVGWRGVTERDTGNPMPERFPSEPGTDHPLAQPLATAMALRGAALLDLTPSDPLRLGGFAARDGDRLVVVVANLTPDPIAATVDEVAGGELVRLDLGPYEVATVIRSPARATSANPFWKR